MMLLRTIRAFSVLLGLTAMIAAADTATAAVCTGTQLGQTSIVGSVKYFSDTDTCVISLDSFGNTTVNAINFFTNPTLFPDQYSSYITNGGVIAVPTTSMEVGGLDASQGLFAQLLNKDFNGSFVAYIVAALQGVTYYMTVNLLADNGRNIQIVSASVSTSPVPIPAALPLLASGLGALGFIGWRRKRRALVAA